MISQVSSGFISSDIAQIVRNCHLKAIKNGQDKISHTLLQAQVLEQKPLSIQDMIVEVPKVLWEEIGGNEDIKFQVK